MAKHTIGEEWRPVVGFDGRYEVSSVGTVSSLRWNGGNRRERKVLSPFMTAKGYLLFRLWNGTTQQSLWAHRIVLDAFVGPKTPGQQCNHKNGIKDDNRVDSLEWVYPRENIRHAIDVLGRTYWKKGQLAHNAKLTAAKAVLIRRMWDGGKTQKEIGLVFGVNKTTIGCVVRGQTWRSTSITEIVPKSKKGKKTCRRSK